MTPTRSLLCVGLQIHRLFLFLPALVVCVPLVGCAIQYTDSKTGADHIWGFGHLAMKATVPNEGKKAVVRGVTLCGVALGLRDGHAFFEIGWEEQQRVEVVDENTQVRLEAPSSDLLNIRVGSRPPGGDTKKEGR
ncbi:MAG: hypothetical protein ACHQ9S_26260 [Candidatus Binatia bacterium]